MAPITDALTANPLPRDGPPIIASIVVALVAAGLGYAGAILAGALPANWAALGCFVAAAIPVGGVAGSLQRRRARLAAAGLQALRAQAGRVAALEDQIEARRAKLRQIRHDVRGALSPALLASDRLLASSDPAIKRSAEIVVRSVDRAIVLLSEAPDAPAANPPDGP